MKMTVEIPSPLLSEVKETASREGTTVRALIEEGLRRVLEERRREPRSSSAAGRRFVEKDCSQSLPTVPGIRSVIRSTKGAGPDRRRYQPPGLRASRRFPLARQKHSPFLAS